MSRERRSVTASVSPGASSGANQTTLVTELQQLRDLLDAGDVESARRFVTELEVRWPDSERVRHYAHVLAPPKVRMRSDIQVRPPKPEWEWLRQHAHEHPGCWLAVLGDRLVAVDPDGSVVRTKAREVLGKDRPVIYYQPARRDSQ